MREKARLAIFDLDGTLFDTRRTNWLSYRDALEPFGVNLDYEYFSTFCNGRHYTVFIPELLRKAGNAETSISEKTEIVHQRKKELYGSFLNEIILNSHLFCLLNCIKNSYHTALVTTASRKNCMELLNFYGKETVFDLILTGEDVKNKKPDPEGFLKAMHHFGIKGEDTLVFEDSDIGIEAAEKTGATVFAARGFA